MRSRLLLCCLGVLLFKFLYTATLRWRRNQAAIKHRTPGKAHSGNTHPPGIFPDAAKHIA